MPLGTVEIERFGGLQLADDPADVGLEGALVAKNVEIGPDRSFVRTRAGLSAVGATNAMGTGDVTAYRLLAQTTGGGNDVLLAVCWDATAGLTRLVQYTIGGVVTLISTWASTFAGFYDAVNFGGPNIVYAFIASEGALMQRFASGFIAASVGKPRFLAVSPTSNRLVQARFAAAADSPTGALGSSSTVFFSDAGAPETFGANNYVHLRPGDGEDIRGMAVWRGQLFVFKQTACFIFSGESTSSTGTPVFDYRTVTLPAPIAPRSASLYGGVVAAGADGAYFLTTAGVYRTTGGPPALVSQPLSELFRTGALSAQGLSCAGQRVILQTNASLYVMDERNGQWVLWSSILNRPSAPLAEWTTFDPTRATPLAWAVNRTLYVMDQTQNVDVSSQITASYQTGFSDLGASTVKTVRGLQLWGHGTLVARVATDYGAVDDPSANTVLGTAPAIATAIQSRARRGTHFSLQFDEAASNLLGWRVQSASLHVRRPRAPRERP